MIADHARTVAFLLADGVFPSNEGRGYVLRRILRRAVRHAWLLGRLEPTLVHVVDSVIEEMGDAFPELRQRRQHILETTRADEERFLTTVDEGSFTVTRGGAKIGREEFRIVRQPAGREVQYVARALGAYGDRRISPALQTDASGVPMLYQVEVRGTARSPRARGATERAPTPM